LADENPANLRLLRDFGQTTEAFRDESFFLHVLAMFSRTVKASLLGTRWAPRPANSLRRTAQLQTVATPKTSIPPTSQPLPDPPQNDAPDASASTQTTAPLPFRGKPPPPKPAEPLTDAAVDPSVAALLPLLRAQPPFYATIHIHEKPYLVTAGDELRLPSLLKGVRVGDVLRLTRASLLGSRDYTLKAGTTTKGERRRYLDERLFVCRARVVGVTQEPFRVKVKKKPRIRHERHVISKHTYTQLRIMEVTVNGPEALEAENDTRTE
jgi:large subunit ribosomal protein L21